jgi:PBP1b-binding outer membrane lipoprotein LpoB
VLAGSTIVINVPEAHLNTNKTRSTDDSFKTKDFFNQAEQQIERVLISTGFRVVSRSKLEAKLRDLRDAARCRWSDFDCLRSRMTDDMKPIFEDLKRKFDAHEITENDYMTKVRDLYEQSENRSAGRARNEGEKELTDISEVIRAAQSGEVKADYILQINNFETEKNTLKRIDLRHFEPVRDFISKYPSLLNSASDDKFMITCSPLAAELNAQLIHVQTGEIVWIGNHELNEWHANINPLTIEMGQRTFATNYSKIKNSINEANQPLARELRAKGQSFNIPSFLMQTDFIPPIVISGRCELENRSTDNIDDLRSQLARRVAKELVETIKVSNK